MTSSFYFDFFLKFGILLHLTLLLIPTSLVSNEDWSYVQIQRTYPLQILITGFTIFVCYQNDSEDNFSACWCFYNTAVSIVRSFKVMTLQCFFKGMNTAGKRVFGVI